MIERWPVTADDGHTLELLVAIPEAPRAFYVFVAALGVEARYYTGFAEAMAAKGIGVALCDLRGNGTSSLRPRRAVDFGYREIVESDIPAALRVVHERVSPSVPLFVGGHSLGGQLMLLHVAATDPDIAGMIQVACAIPYFRSWFGFTRAYILFATVLFPVVGTLMGYVPGKRLGFGGTEARTLMRDWSRNARSARYEPIGSQVDYEAALREVDVDLLTVSIAGDSMGPANAVDFTFEKAPKIRGHRVEATLSEPKPGPGAHVRWARDSQSVVSSISGWIDKK
ncbi:MAG: alpha/beta fold hydrolase [Myxococcota bacterium]